MRLMGLRFIGKVDANEFLVGFTKAFDWARSFVDFGDAIADCGRGVSSGERNGFKLVSFIPD